MHLKGVGIDVVICGRVNGEDTLGKGLVHRVRLQHDEDQCVIYRTAGGGGVALLHRLRASHERVHQSDLESSSATA